ncbi:hypothetical protein Hanom_Chr15g01404541 [Helianthus anomalus]
MKNCKDCSTITYLNTKKVDDLTKRVRDVEDQIINRDKMLKVSNERSKELTEKIESDKSDIETIRKENEKLIHEKIVTFQKILKSLNEQLRILMNKMVKQQKKIFNCQGCTE